MIVNKVVDEKNRDITKWYIAMFGNVDIQTAYESMPKWHSDLYPLEDWTLSSDENDLSEISEDEEEIKFFDSEEDVVLEHINDIWSDDEEFLEPCSNSLTEDIKKTGEEKCYAKEESNLIEKFLIERITDTRTFPECDLFSQTAIFVAQNPRPRRYKKKNTRGRNMGGAGMLNNLSPAPPYRMRLRFMLEPASACVSITGLTPSNIGKAAAFQIFSGASYILPPNGVLAPTTNGLFRYIKIRRVDIWGPTAGKVNLAVNTDTGQLFYPKPTKTANSASVTARPHDCLVLTKPFPMVIDTNSAASSNLFIVSFETTAVAGGDNTVVLDMQLVLFS